MSDFSRIIKWNPDDHRNTGLVGAARYAAIVSLSNALNVVPSDEKLARALENISRTLKPNGVLIASIVCQNPTIPTNELAPLVTWLYFYHRGPWQKITIPTIDHTLDLLKKNSFKTTHTTTTDNKSYPRLSFRATKL